MNQMISFLSTKYEETIGQTRADDNVICQNLIYSKIMYSIGQSQMGKMKRNIFNFTIVMLSVCISEKSHS